MGIYIFGTLSCEFNNFHDVVTDQGIGHDFTTKCTNFDLSFSIGNRIGAFVDMGAAFCLLILFVEIDNFFVHGHR